MKFLFYLLISSILLFSSENKYYKEFNLLSNKQIKNILISYKYGLSNNLEWTLAAIAWQESQGGKYKIGTLSNDYGLCQININTHLRDINKENTPRNISKYATKLIEDDKYNLKWATHTLLYWKNYHKNNWLKTWGSYNGGFKPNMKYANQIKLRIMALKKHFKPYLLYLNVLYLND